MTWRLKHTILQQFIIINHNEHLERPLRMANFLEKKSEVSYQKQYIKLVVCILTSNTANLLNQLVSNNARARNT